jgi:hypothetical protein
MVAAVRDVDCRSLVKVDIAAAVVDCGKKVSLQAPEHRTQTFDGVEGRDGKTATPLHYHRGHPVWAAFTLVFAMSAAV